jgi:hypothetical protein
MGGASTNEERFIASCKTVGEADVRQKLASGRYSERRAEWARAWLEQLDVGKSDATKAEELSMRLLKSQASSGHARPSILLLLLLAILAGGLGYLSFR